MSERARYWGRWVEAWEKSGLSQAEFCRRRGIAAVNFGWWKRKLSGARDQGRRRRRRRSAAGGQREHAAFVEVALPSRVLAAGPTSSISAAASAAGYEIALPGGALIRLPGDFDPEKVSQLIRAVASAC